MQKKILNLMFLVSKRYRKQLLVVMSIITIFFGIFIPQLKISSSQKDLIPMDHPVQKKYTKFMKEFGIADNLIVVLEGDTDTLKASAEEFAKGILKEKKWVDSIFYKMDIENIKKNGILFVPYKDLKTASSFVSKSKSAINLISKTNNLKMILDRVVEGAKSPNLSFDSDFAPYIISGLTAFFDEWGQWINDPSHNNITVLDRVLLPPGGNEAAHFLKSEGFLFSRDYKMLFLLVQPKSSNDDISYLRPFIGNIRKACNRVFEKFPTIKGKVKVAFTGMPAHILTETETIYSDVGRAGLISIFLVAIILFFGFGSLRKMIIGVIPLASGMIITLGLIAIVFGKLNLISSSFLAVLFGIGIDFGIYLIRRTEEELGNGLSSEEAVHTAVVVTGKGIVTGGFTTGLAFLAISFSEFVGYSELGLVAGLGVFIVMATTFLIMPAMLLLFKVEPKFYDISKEIKISTRSKEKKTLWLIIVPSVLLSIFSIFAAFNVEMDYNALKLLPRDTESTSYHFKMEENSDFKSSLAYVTADNFDDLKEVVKKMKTLPVVSRIDSFSELIPDQQNEKIKIIKKYRHYLKDFHIPFYSRNVSKKEYLTLIDELLSFFEEAQEKAFSSGLADLVDGLDKLIEKLNILKNKFSEKNNSYVLLRTKAFEKELFQNIGKMINLLHDWLKAKPITEDNFSPQMAKRFKSPQGTYVAYIYPKGSIWNLEFLDKFIKELKSISDNITGFPVTHQVFIRQAAKAVIESVLYALIIVVFLLAFDFRSLSSVALALVPLGVGMLWLQAAVFIVDIPYNVANIAGLPLLLGLGVVYGVHIVHRWRENTHLTAFAAAHTTGRGVSFAAFTTMSGLLSIVFARHNGVSSFGVIILFGITLCLITALYVLPTIIDLIYLKNNEDKDDKKK